MKELLHTTQVIVTRMLALLSVFVEGLWEEILSVLTPTLAGIIIIAFLLGLLFGRMSKRAVRESKEEAFEKAPERVVLDLEKLTPLGMSAEEEAESEAMDISAMRHDEKGTKTTPSGGPDQLGLPPPQNNV